VIRGGPEGEGICLTLVYLGLLVFESCFVDVDLLQDERRMAGWRSPIKMGGVRVLGIPQ